MNVYHAKENWENFVPSNVETLIVGSFNPLNPNGNNVNYYYGRNTNYLWKALGDLLHDNLQYFFDNGVLNTWRVIEAMEKHKFCFLDLIDSIEIIGQNLPHEEDYANNKIFIGFSDAVLFATNTLYTNYNINKRRNYNEYILNFLESHKPKRIIHTLGNSTINLNFNSRYRDLNQFLKVISETSNRVNTDIVTLSISPSQTNINRRGLYNDLRDWLGDNLNLNI